MFPFGVSIGDFIAFIETVVTAINALKDATGAAAEYRGVVRELESLGMALECVDRLEVANQDQIEGLKCVAANAGQTILEYLGRLKKHEPSLRSSGSIQKWRDGLRKIQWSLYTKDDVRRFQAQLQSHVASLNVLMSQIIMTSATAAHNVTKTALIRIEAKVDRSKVTQLMVQAVIVSALARCWEEFRSVMAMILITNFRIFDTILGLSRVPRQVEFDKPITFEDAHNRLCPLNIQWLDTWEHFETVLKWRFSNVPGLQKIETGEYVLHDVFSKADVVRSGAIEKAFRPGRRINMSIIFKLQGSKQAMCPKCLAPVLELPRSDTNCENCGLCYRRVEPSGVENLGSVTETEEISYQTAAPQPAMPSQATIGPSEDQISDFARVRILNISKMKVLQHMKQTVRIRGEKKDSTVPISEPHTLIPRLSFARNSISSSHTSRTMPQPPRFRKRLTYSSDQSQMISRTSTISKKPALLSSDAYQAVIRPHITKRLSRPTMKPQSSSDSRRTYVRHTNAWLYNDFSVKIDAKNVYRFLAGGN